MTESLADRIRCPLAAAAETYGDLPALISPDQTITYTEYHRMSGRVAGNLLLAGVKTGDRIAIVLPVCATYPVLMMAAFRIGAVICPLSDRLPDMQRHEIVRNIRAEFVVTDSAFDDSGTADFKTLSLGRLIENTPPEPVIDAEMAPDREATIILTSGTTAHPKAALLTYGNHYYNAVGSNENIALQPHDRWLVSLPLYHVGGMAILFRTLLAGAAAVCPEHDSPLDEAILKHGVTHLSLISTQLYRLLRAEADITGLAAQLKAVLLGGSDFPSRLLARATDAGLPLCTSYGLTEMGSQVTTTAPGDPVIRLGTSGRLLNHREMKMSDDGEILVKGSTRFAGYVELDGLQCPFDQAGWFATGDCGRVNADGYLVVTGRKDNMFVSGGENIHPEEIERALRAIDSIEDAIVVGVPHDEWGVRPVAFVKIASGEPIDDRTLTGLLQPHLPRFKIPDRFFPWPATASEGSIKPSRMELKNLAVRLLSIEDD